MWTRRAASRIVAPQHGKNTAPRPLSASLLQIFAQIHNKTHNTITDLTPDNAGELVQRVGVRVRARAVCEPAMTKLLHAAGIATQKTDIVNIPQILSTGTTPTDPGTTTPTTDPDDPNGGND